MARLALDHFVDKLFQNLSKNAQIFFEIDVGGVRMDFDRLRDRGVLA